MAGPGIEPGTSGLSVRRATDITVIRFQRILFRTYSMLTFANFTFKHIVDAYKNGLVEEMNTQKEITSQTDNNTFSVCLLKHMFLKTN